MRGVGHHCPPSWTCPLISWWCRLRCLCHGAQVGHLSTCSLTQKNEMCESPGFLREGKGKQLPYPSSIVPGLGREPRCRTTRRELFLSFATDLAALGAGFGKVHPTLTPPQHPSQWVAPSHQIYEKSLTQMLFLWEDSFWRMLGRSADSPRWAPVVFSEHWMLYLSHLVKLQCYHWEFQLHNYILHFEGTTNAWINVNFLGLSLIFSKSPPGTIKREVIVCINYTYAPFVIPLQGQKDIRRYTNTRPSVWIASVWVRQEMEGICSDKTWCLSPALWDLLSSAVLRYSLQIIFEAVIQGEKG